MNRPAKNKGKKKDLTRLKKFGIIELKIKFKKEI